MLDRRVGVIGIAGSASGNFPVLVEISGWVCSVAAKPATVNSKRGVGES